MAEEAATKAAARTERQMREGTHQSGQSANGKARSNDSYDATTAPIGEVIKRRGYQ
jgi:hypothetical protein